MNTVLYEKIFNKNKMAFKEQLMDIGLSKNEVSIYERLLISGSQPVSLLAKRLNINRSTVYSVLRTLKSKGMVSSHQKNGMEYFMSSSPNSVVGYIDRKVQELDYYRCAFINEIPKLQSKSEKYKIETPLVRHYDSKQGVTEVLNDALLAEELLMFSPIDEWDGGNIGEFLLRYMSMRSKDAKVKIITLKTKKSDEFFNKHFAKNSQINVLFLREKTKTTYFSVENSVKIYDNKVSMVNIDTENSHGVIVESRGIAEVHRQMFELLWENIKYKQ